MVVGVLYIEVHIDGVFSLKEKRGVIHKIIEKVRNRFPVSIAEVDFQDVKYKAGIGIAIVNSNKKLINSMIDRIVNFVEEIGLARITDSDFEIFTY